MLLGIGDDGMEMDGGGFTGGLWNTFSAGASKPVSDKIELHAEAAVVMSGIKLANDPSLPGKRTNIYWGTMLPLIVDIGMSYAF